MEELVIMEERAKKIIEACLQEKSKNPIEIFYHIAQNGAFSVSRPADYKVNHILLREVQL